MYNGVFKLTNIRNLNQIGGITEELHKDKHSKNCRMFICSKKKEFAHLTSLLLNWTSPLLQSQKVNRSGYIHLWKIKCRGHNKIQICTCTIQTMVHITKKLENNQSTASPKTSYWATSQKAKKLLYGGQDIALSYK